MQNEEKYKFGLIGCGRVSENHLSALTSGNIPSELVAVCDLDPEKARSKGEKYHIPWYTDFHKMMEEHPEIQIVNVAVPTGYHAPVVTDLAQYGRHIVTEKPMALKVSDCDAMIAAYFGMAEAEGIRIEAALDIRRRLEMIYGDDACLTIVSGDVTKVTIRMPDRL